MIPYDVLSGWYDELMADVPYEDWTERIIRILNTMESRPKRLLELACGTGRITGGLLSAGYWVTGIDRSESMLQEAQDTLGGAGGRLKLIASDMLAFRTTEQYDAVISVCDGFNYLSEVSDLEAMLTQCQGLCRPGGLIIFDLSTDWKFKNHLKDTIIAENHEDMAFIWENHYDEMSRQLDFDLTFFIKDGECFRRETEHHVQRAHSPEEIEAICGRLNLTVEGFFDDYSDAPIKPDSERFHCIIRNGGKQ